MPLIDIQPLPDTRALQAAGRHWADYAAVMFVSNAAVAHFFASNQALAQTKWTQGATKKQEFGCLVPGRVRRCWPKEFRPSWWMHRPPRGRQFDSEALWQQVQRQIGTGARVLIVRGDSRQTDGDGEGAALGQGVGRDWLAQRLQQAGAVVDFVVAYRRGAPVWGAGERALAAAAAVMVRSGCSAVPKP